MQMRDNRNFVHRLFPRLSWLKSTCRGLIPRRQKNLYREEKAFPPFSLILNLSWKQEERKRARTLDLFEYTFSRWKNASHLPCSKGVWKRAGFLNIPTGLWDQIDIG